MGGAAFLGSGCMTAVTTTVKGVTTTSFQLAGMGDVINTMLTAAVAVLFIKWVGNRFGSLGIVFFPILAGTGVGFLGSLTKPYVSLVTTAIGDVINTFTKLAPYPMCILIAMSFAIAGLAAEGETEINHAECVNISYPGFYEDLKSLQMEEE